MYAGRVACCLLVRHVSATGALLTLEKRWDRRTDGRQTDAIRLPLDVASVTAEAELACNLTAFIKSPT